MRPKEVLSKLVRLFFGDTRQAIVSYIVVVLIVAGGGLLALSKTALNFSTLLLTTPTPLWATISLVLLVYLYIRITIRKQHSSTTTSSSTITAVVLDEPKISILKLLFSQNMSTEQISDSLGLQRQTAAYHLEELAKLNMVILQRYSRPIAGDAYGNFQSLQRFSAWTIKQPGRKYLLDNKIVS